MKNKKKQKISKAKAGYMFTNKNHPAKGIMATVLGVISVISIGVSVYLTVMQRGEAAVKYGAAVLFALIFAFAGMILSVMSRMEKDRYYLFPTIGIILNFLALAATSFILFAGAYGL